MGKFLVLQLVILAVSVNAEKSVVPDLSCHPGFELSLADKENGMGVSALNHLQAERTKKGCYSFQTGVMAWHGITEWDGKRLRTENDISSTLKTTFFKAFENDSAEKIAKKVTAECSKYADEAGNIPCEMQTAFYECVENAWAC